MGICISLWDKRMRITADRYQRFFLRVGLSSWIPMNFNPFRMCNFSLVNILLPGLGNRETKHDHSAFLQLVGLVLDS